MIVKKEFELPIYDNNRICIIFTDNQKELEKAVGKDIYDFENLYGCVYNGKNKKGYKTIYIIFNTDSKTPINTGVLVHESVHAANRVFSNIFHNIDSENDEPQAYLTEYIFNRVEETYNKYKDECNKKTT